MTPEDDPYTHLVNQTAIDMLHALLAYPPGDKRGVRALRGASHLLISQYGAEGGRDLAEVLAADLAEIMVMQAHIEGVTPSTFLDRWTHDVELPTTDDGPSATP